MFNMRVIALSLGLLMLQTSTAAPAPDPQKFLSTYLTDFLSPITIKPTLIVPTATVTSTITASKCPGVNCRKICATPTVTTEATGHCSFPIETCPVADCLSVPAITSTSTRYCKDGGCRTIPSTLCEKLPTVTVIPPCPTECPELCPIPVITVAVACTTSVKPV